MQLLLKLQLKVIYEALAYSCESREKMRKKIIVHSSFSLSLLLSLSLFLSLCLNLSRVLSCCVYQEIAPFSRTDHKFVCISASLPTQLTTYTHTHIWTHRDTHTVDKLAHKHACTDMHRCPHALKQMAGMCRHADKCVCVCIFSILLVLFCCVPKLWEVWWRIARSCDMFPVYTALHNNYPADTLCVCLQYTCVYSIVCLCVLACEFL